VDPSFAVGSMTNLYRIDESNNNDERSSRGIRDVSSMSNLLSNDRPGDRSSDSHSLTDMRSLVDTNDARSSKSSRSVAETDGKSNRMGSVRSTTMSTDTHTITLDRADAGDVARSECEWVLVCACACVCVCVCVWVLVVLRALQPVCSDCGVFPFTLSVGQHNGFRADVVDVDDALRSSSTSLPSAANGQHRQQQEQQKRTPALAVEEADVVDDLVTFESKGGMQRLRQTSGASTAVSATPTNNDRASEQNLPLTPTDIRVNIFEQLAAETSTEDGEIRRVVPGAPGSERASAAAATAAPSKASAAASAAPHEDTSRVSPLGLPETTTLITPIILSSGRTVATDDDEILVAPPAVSGDEPTGSISNSHLGEPSNLDAFGSVYQPNMMQDHSTESSSNESMSE
jgi:hypothetical protein